MVTTFQKNASENDKYFIYFVETALFFLRYEAFHAWVIFLWMLYYRYLINWRIADVFKEKLVPNSDCDRMYEIYLATYKLVYGPPLFFHAPLRKVLSTSHASTERSEGNGNIGKMF